MASTKKVKTQSKKQCNTEPSTLNDLIEVDKIFQRVSANKFVRESVERCMKEAITGEIVTGKCNKRTRLTVDEIVDRIIKDMRQ